MRVTSKEIVRSFATLGDAALREPVVITKNGRDRLVLMSIEEYERLSGNQSDEPEISAAPKRDALAGELASS
jgi:PHD/YefM family antitoxin component YafN of YafNO toxin-antitoxin module